MTSDTDVLNRIRKSNLDEVEAAWNGRISATPRDLRWFFEVARTWFTKSMVVLEKMSYQPPMFRIGTVTSA